MECFFSFYFASEAQLLYDFFSSKEREGNDIFVKKKFGLIVGNGTP